MVKYIVTSKENMDLLMLSRQEMLRVVNGIADIKYVDSGSQRKGHNGD